MRKMAKNTKLFSNVTAISSNLHERLFIFSSNRRFRFMIFIV